MLAGKDLLSYNFHEPIVEEPTLGEDGRGMTRYQIPLFKFSSVCAATDDFSAINKLGKGGFGAVYKVYMINFFMDEYNYKFSIPHGKLRNEIW